MKSLFCLLFWICSLSIPALSDDQSGPGRTTLQSFEGGTIFAVNEKATSAKKTAPGEITVKTGAGKIFVKTTPWGYDIAWAQGKIKVSSSLNELIIEEGKQKIKVTTQFGGKTVVDIPGHKMTFQQGGLNDMTVSGDKGTLKVEKGLNELKLVSSAGTTTLVREFDEFKNEGPALSRHPYTFRAFLLERNGVGVMINLLPYHHEALRPALDWSRVKSL